MINKSKQIVKRNVNDIFDKSKYIIPIYQRNYSWKQEQIERLIEDIIDFQQTDDVQEYFLGNLIVDKIAHHQYSVIDGQQRLTTLFLLLNYLKISSVKPDSLSFESREKSNVTLKRIIEGQIESDEFTSNEVISGYKIINQYFNTRKAQNNNIDEYNDFVEIFKRKLEHIKLLRIQVPKDIDLNHYFEIMNTRGEQLELHEVAKARILSQFTKKEEQQAAAMVWNACSNMESYIQMNFEKDIRYSLFGNYSSNDDNKGWGQFVAIDFFDLSQKINAKKKMANSKSYSLLDILKNREIEERIDATNDLEQERFSPIIDFPNFLLHVNAVTINDRTNDDSLDDKYFMKTLHHNWQDEKNARNFIYSLLLTRFKFDKFIIKRDKQRDLDVKWSLKRLYIYRQDNTKYSDKPQYKNSFDDETKNRQLMTLQASMRVTFTSPKTMHWITEILQLDWIDLTSEKIILLLEQHCINKLGDYRRYSGFGIPRIAFTFLDYLLWRDRYPYVEENWEIIYRTSIEHFSPQHPADLKEAWIDDDLNCFGNLALINIESNSKFSNLAPESKIRTYGSVVHQSPKLQLMAKKVENNRGVWNVKAARDLQEEFFKILDIEVEK